MAGKFLTRVTGCVEDWGGGWDGCIGGVWRKVSRWQFLAHFGNLALSAIYHTLYSISSLQLQSLE